MSRLVIIIAIVILSVACDNQELIISQYQPEYTANSFFATDDCIGVEARMISPEYVEFFTGRYTLFTDDDFKTIYGNELFGDYCPTRTMYFNYTMGWLLDENSFHPQASSVSLTYLYIVPKDEPYYSSKSMHISVEDLYTAPNYPYSKIYTTVNLPFFIDENNLLMAIVIPDFPTLKMDIFQVTVNADFHKTSNFLSRIPTRLTPFKFFSYNNGYGLLTKTACAQEPCANEEYVLHESFNGGTTWSSGVLISNTQDIKEVKGKDGITIAYSDETVYIRQNVGAVWQELTTNFDGSIEDVLLLSEDVLYTVISVSDDERPGKISKLYKSFNLGQTWETNGTLFYGERISFVDQQHGVATSNGTLQVTHDGGESWRLILVSPNYD